MKKKLTQCAGVSLTELLAALLLLGILTAAVTTGMSVALRTYGQSVALSRAQTTLSTLVSSIGDELRMASKVTVVNEEVVYTSSRTGTEASLSVNDNGEVLTGATLLISNGMYSNGTLRVENFSLTYDGQGVFSLYMTVDGAGGISATADTSFRWLNYRSETL